MNIPGKKNAFLSLIVVLGAFLLFSTRSHAQSTSALWEVLLDTPDEIDVTYPDEIDQYPALAQRLGAWVRERLEMWSSADDDRPPSIEMDYQLVAHTPRIVAVFGSGMDWNVTTSPVLIQETLVWLADKQQWLTAPMLISDIDGWLAVRDYVCEDLYQQIREISEEDQSGKQCLKTRHSWMDNGIHPAAYENFLPLMNEDGLVTALRFVFPPETEANVGKYQHWEVDVPSKVLYPYLATDYRDLFMPPSSPRAQ